ncbi:hypothetical protein ACHAWO_009511 [Cyclotella atomus]|uniref:J domain-containing protein n=1 Tax=Cyclotella atomus TaxID=382360 RepID=A0ABD3N2X0_9STRA
MAVIALVRSAFGHSCLYKSLNATSTCNAEELKRAYRRAALKYHPDRAASGSDANKDDAIASTTLKFQAVSAAYQILMDENKRYIYDSTGRIPDDDHSACSDDENADSSAARRNACNHTNKDQWETFFYSIFHEVISAKTTYESDVKNYRGSGREQSDVIEYYNICKGDWSKVVECIAFGASEDVERWKHAIIEPALMRGDIPDFGSKLPAIVPGGKQKKVSLDESSSDDDIPVGKGNKKLHNSAKRKQISLDDSSSDEDINDNSFTNRRLKKKVQSTNSEGKAAEASMSKRDKLEYRTAKKRKDKKAKELEVAQLFQSKDWGDAFSMNGQTRKHRNAGSLSNQMLDSIERKYGKSSGSRCNRKR